MTRIECPHYPIRRMALLAIVAATLTACGAGGMSDAQRRELQTIASDTCAEMDGAFVLSAVERIGEGREKAESLGLHGLEFAESLEAECPDLLDSIDTGMSALGDDPDTFQYVTQESTAAVDSPERAEAPDRGPQDNDEAALELDLQTDTAELGPQPFDTAMESKFLSTARRYIESPWHILTDDQLVVVGRAYCDFRVGEEQMTAAANAVVLLVFDGVAIGYDSSGFLDEDAATLAAIAIVSAEDSVCTSFNPNVTGDTRPGDLTDQRYDDVGEYLRAAPEVMGVPAEYIASTTRSRVPPSAEQLYIELLERESSVQPVILGSTEAEDRWLALGYSYCVVADEDGVGFARITLRQFNGLSIGHLSRTQFASVNYLCPEYLKVAIAW